LVVQLVMPATLDIAPEALGGHWIYSKPDYIIAQEGGIMKFQKVGFKSPPIHDTDHRAVIASIRKGQRGSLMTYQWSCQQFPIMLSLGSKTK
jgi:hypothetical protein